MKAPKHVVYRAFSPSRNPDITKVHYNQLDAEMDVAARNTSARVLSPSTADYVLQRTEVKWVEVAPDRPKN